MFIKVFSKSKKSTGDQSLYYRLCESYRTDNSVRHHTILYLGNLEELSSSEQKNKLCKRIESLVKESRTGIKDLFDFENDIVEINGVKLVENYFILIYVTTFFRFLFTTAWARSISLYFFGNYRFRRI